MLFTTNSAYNYDQILTTWSVHSLRTFDLMRFAINQATRPSYQGKYSSCSGVIQVGRDFVRYLVQCLAESCVSSAVRPSFLGICPVGSQKPPRTVLLSFLLGHLNCNLNNTLLY